MDETIKGVMKGVMDGITSETMSTPQNPAALILSMYGWLMQRLPAWMTVLVVTAVFGMFVALFLETTNITWVIQRIEKAEMSAPDGPDEEVKDPPNLVRSYALRADMVIASGARPPLFKDSIMAFCNGQSRLVSCTYRHAYWLPLKKTSQATLLEEHVTSGKVRYAYLGGTAVRIEAARNREEFKSIVPSGAAGSEHVFFVIAAAFDAETDDSACELAPLMQQHHGTLPNGTEPQRLSVLPIASDPLKLRRLMSRPPREIQLQLWGYGFNV
jgi:hypothetical protein